MGDPVETQRDAQGYDRTPLERAAQAFIVMIRDRGMGRFMPDELPLLNAMAAALVGAEGFEAENAAWLEASKTWARIERRMNAAESQRDALLQAARTRSHHGHHYDIDEAPRTDCVLCAAIENRFQPRWMEEPFEWLRDPIVRELP